MVLMILVNSQTVPFPYPLLVHADWDGFTLADFVFPAFLFIVGVTLVISFNYHLNIKKEKKSDLYSSIFTRTLVLIAIGLILNAIPLHIDIATLRFYGILQRIAVCYFIASLLYLHTSVRTQSIIFICIIIGYWVLLTMVPVPGSSDVMVPKAGSWLAYVDQHIFAANHLYFKTYDPEGFLSTITSLANTIAGVLTGILLVSSTTQTYKTSTMALWGAFFLLLGWAWSYQFPLNKDLWTSTFILVTTGISLLVFAACYLVIDCWGYKRWSVPLQMFGMNALFIFIFHVFCLKMQMLWTYSLNGTTVSLKRMLTEQLFGWFSPANASLLFSLSFILVNFIIAAFLYKRKIFIRI